MVNKTVPGTYNSGGFYNLIVTQEGTKYFVPLYIGYKCDS